MTRFRVVHRTDYQYGRSMSDGFTVARVQPRSMPGQALLTAALEGYALAKVFGKGAGLDALKEAMAGRYSRKRKASPVAAA